MKTWGLSSFLNFSIPQFLNSPVRSFAILETRRFNVAGSRDEGDELISNTPVATRYSANGHPSIEQLTAEQRTGPITDVQLLHGDFWPEQESIEDFLAALHEWRGHKKTDRAS